MSDETETTTSTPEAPESAPEAPEAPSPTDAATTTDDAEALRSDAVKWRRQLRATEAKRDAAHARIDEYDRAEVDRIARSLFQDPRDPWTVLEVSELRDEESGRLDVGKAAKPWTGCSRSAPIGARRARRTPTCTPGRARSSMRGRASASLLLVGPTRAGKGVIARTFERLLGRRNCAAPTLNSLSGDFGLAPLLKVARHGLGRATLRPWG